MTVCVLGEGETRLHGIVSLFMLMEEANQQNLYQEKIVFRESCFEVRNSNF